LKGLLTPYHYWSFLQLLLPFNQAFIPISLMLSILHTIPKRRKFRYFDWRYSHCHYNILFYGCLSRKTFADVIALFKNSNSVWQGVSAVQHLEKRVISFTRSLYGLVIFQYLCGFLRYRKPRLWNERNFLLFCLLAVSV
jgi:hypothetical protein